MTLNNSQSKDSRHLLKEILDDLILHNPNIISALVVSDDGLNVASGIPHATDDAIALTASNLTDTAKEFAQRLEQGRLKRILIEGEQRTTMVINAGKRTVLFVLISADEKLGLVNHSVRQAANKITALFG